MSTTPATSPAVLCRAFGYPDAVRDVLEALVDAARSHLEPLGLRAIMLGGSLPRGELSWLTEEDGGLHLLSDIDAALYTRRRDPEREAALAEAAHKLTTAHARSPLFHVDAGVHRLFMKRHTVWTYEFRMTAATLWGEDLRWLLPRVTRRSIDLGNTAELVLVRLWNQLLYTPLGMVRGDPSVRERVVFGAVTNRNILDLPTILLAHHGVLRPGYAARDAFLRESPPLAPGFGADFVALCGAALDAKRHPSVPDPDSPGRLLGETLDAFAHLTAHLARLADPSIPGDARLDWMSPALDGAITKALREAPVLRWRRRALELSVRGRRLLAGDSASALRYDRARAIRFLLALHRALAHRLSGALTEAHRALNDATRLAATLGRVVPGRVVPDRVVPGRVVITGGEEEGWAERWEDLREWFIALHGGVLFKNSQRKIDACLTTARWRG